MIIINKWMAFTHSWCNLYICIHRVSQRLAAYLTIIADILLYCCLRIASKRLCTCRDVPRVTIVDSVTILCTDDMV